MEKEQQQEFQDNRLYRKKYKQLISKVCETKEGMVLVDSILNMCDEEETPKAIKLFLLDHMRKDELEVEYFLKEEGDLDE